MILSGTALSATGGRTMGSSKPLVRIISFTGDSITDNLNVYISDTARHNSSSSFANHALAVLKGRCFAQYNPSGNSAGWPTLGTYEFATFGATTDQIQANHLAQLTANPSDLVAVLCGHNDLGNLSRSAATTFGLIQTYVNAIRATGQRVCVMAVLPRTVGNNPVGSDGKTYVVRVQELNVLLKNWCATQNIPFCDWFSTLTDGSGYWLAGYSNDAVHPSITGAVVMGEFFANFLLANYTLGPEIYDAAFQSTLNPASNATSGWSIFQDNDPGPSSFTQSTVAGTDGLGDWQRFTTVHASPSGNVAQLTKSSLPMLAGTVDGNLVQAVIEARLVTGSLTLGLQFEFIVNGRTQSIIFPGNLATYPAFGGLFFYQPVPVLASSTATCRITIQGNATLEVRRFGFRRANLIVPPFI